MKLDETGTVLRKARQLLNLTQEEVAEMAGINLGQYQRLEYNIRNLSDCSMKVGLSVCYVLNLDPFLLVLHKTKL